MATLDMLRIAWRARLVKRASLLGVVFILTTGHVLAVNQTPPTHKLTVYRPCYFQVLSSAVPAQQLATSQNYQYMEFTNTTAPRPANTFPATIENFSWLNDPGILVIMSHGSEDSLVVECYRPNEEKLWSEKYFDLCEGRITFGQFLVQLECPDDLVASYLGKMVPDGQGGKTFEIEAYAISLTVSGLKKLFHPGDHEIVFVASCHSAAIREGFRTANVEYFGYVGVTTNIDSDDDYGRIFDRLRGAKLSGHARSVGVFTAERACTAFGFGGLSRNLRHKGPGNTTVAPAVEWLFATPETNCKNGVPNVDPWNDIYFIPRSIQGQVVFDTIMDTTINPAQVVTAEGTCGATIFDQTWVAGHAISFSGFVPQGNGSFRVRTRSVARALGLPNGRELDGNVNPFGGEGIGPNRDDFLSDNTCETLFRGNQEKTSNSYERFAGMLTLTQTEEPVGAPGELTYGFAEISSTDSASQLTFAASDLTSGPNMIPFSAVSFSLGPVDLDAGETTSMDIFVSIPPDQPVGTYTGTFSAIDGSGDTIQTASLEVIVSHFPSIDLPATMRAFVGHTISIPFSVSHPDGHPVAFSADILPAGATLRDYGDGTGLIQYKPDRRGPVAITIDAIDTFVQANTPPSDSRTVEIMAESPPWGRGQSSRHRMDVPRTKKR